jgi:hypothetical protein
MLANQGRLLRLVVETILLPNYSCSDEVTPTIKQTLTFLGLRALQMRITIDMATKMLSLTTRVEELLLDVLDADSEGRVVRAAASLLPGLSVLKLSFWRRAVVDAKALARLGNLSRLEISHNSVSDVSTRLIVDPEQ